jgi:two-component system sensor histidine kinase/response regulator
MKENSIELKEGFILIVDDIPKNLQLLGKTLRDEGYKIAAVSKSEQVLESARKFQPDLILLDVMMPGKNGFEVCQELKKDRDLRHIPIIFLTAKVEQESVVKGLTMGGADYVTKPFNIQELLARVETHISLKLSKDLLKEKNERLDELNTMKDRIYSVIGHDLRGPVNGINGIVGILLNEVNNEPDPEKLKKFLKLVYKSSSDLFNLLTDLLNWARVQSKEIKIRETEFLLKEALEDDLNLIKHDTDRKGIEIKLNLENDIKVKADKSFLKTIVRNFLSNAVKFSSENSKIDIIVDAEEQLSITVRDYGIGMEPQVKENLFKMGNPNHPTKMNNHGAGFGLLLCNELVKLHGGKISVESEEGQGSSFTVTLPQCIKAVIAA